MTRALLALAAFAVAVPAALAGSQAQPGVSSSTITIGGTVPITGPAALFGSVGRGADAYFKYVNAHGGVNGRKIKYVYLDDAYDPSRTVQLTRQLVEQEHVFAVFNTVGTDNNLAIRDYLNAGKVPQLFGGTGTAKIGDDPKGHPWTMGYLPSFRAEGAIYGRSIAAVKNAKVAVLYEDSDFGKDMTNGLKNGLGAKASSIVASQAYEPTDSSIDSQMSSLHASGANVLVLNATPQYAILAYLAAHKFGWHPRIYVSSVCISPNVMDIVRASVGTLANGSLSIAFVKDPTDKAWAKDATVKLYRSILAKYALGREAAGRLQLLRHGRRVLDGRRAQACRQEPDAGLAAPGGDAPERGQSVPAPGDQDRHEPAGLLPDLEGPARALRQGALGAGRAARRRGLTSRNRYIRGVWRPPRTVKPA